MSRHKLWILIDNFKRINFLKYEIKKKLLKSFKYNTYTPNYKRYWAVFFLVKLPRFSNQNYLNNRCSTSGRTRGVFKKTGFSRFILRKEIYTSNIPGFKRASW